MIGRRTLLGAFATAALLPRDASAMTMLPEVVARQAVTNLERRAGGRLGLSVFDSATGRSFGHRMDERFAMCSTFKLPLAAVVLREAAAGRLRLGAQVTIRAADMVPHHPVTGPAMERGEALTIEALARAAQLTSDNVAANLLLARLGGPAGFTRRLRALGDAQTRLDRIEPAMNLFRPGDPRDTTTPRAMALLVARLLAGRALTAAHRAKLIGWMVETKTGLRRIRAGLPAEWRAGDKTGTGMAEGMTDQYNDVAVAWPHLGRAPLVIAAYYDSNAQDADMNPAREAVLAEAGRIAADWFRSAP